MKITIFYSWQSTTCTKYNRNFIYSCIDKGVKKLKRKPEFKDIDLPIQDAVRDEPGSSEVASEIKYKKIPYCDIFIADLSVVNQISPIIKFLQNLSHPKFKPFQNNNVINEYGVAENALGLKKIIGVLNNEYGSPKENPDNIPFDILHISFPIEYRFSKKTKNKEKVKNQLINDLCNALENTVPYAIQSQKNKYLPFIVWNEWEKETRPQYRFYENEKIKQIHGLIDQTLQNTHESVRLMGLSGLGKTRILLEKFRSNNATEFSVLLTGRILYFDCNWDSNVNIHSIVSKIISDGEDKIIILDNCPITTHRKLIPLLNMEDSHISLITIDSNPEEFHNDRIKGVNYIIIQKEELTSIVNDILTENYSMLGKEILERIKEFSQGFPGMAVIIGESIRNGEEFIGIFDDKELLDKLLGQKGQDEICRIILKSCSLFNYFGFQDELKSQLEFIAKNKFITNLNGEGQFKINKFNEICEHYLKREIFEKKGRYIGMRPFPLAIYLALEWLESCTPERLINVIYSIADLAEPDRKQLSEAFAEQMKYLGYNDKAVSIIEIITGHNSPFDDAEVLNTELGSRLFRSFVEVNPEAISKNFERIFSSKSKEELLNFKEGRRNIIWVLEKLCFDKRTFYESTKILYSFAVAENETWANNATGQFLQLFKIFLAGTEANLKERWQIIIWGLNKKELEYDNLALKAMNSGLNYPYFSRSGDSERQGSKILHDYQPAWGEIIEYWTNILSKLSEIIKLNNENSNYASEIIAKNIRSICNARCFNVIIPFVDEISEYKKNDWDEALIGLKDTRKYEKGLISVIQMEHINTLINQFTKTDIGTRFSTIGNDYILDNDEPFSIENIKKEIADLAVEFIEQNIPWEPLFPQIYKHQQSYGCYFGKRIYELLKGNDEKIEKFIKLSIDTILNIEKDERRVDVLGGFIAESDDLIKERFYQNLSNLDALNYLLFYFISIDSSGKKYFSMLFDLIDKHKSDLINFKTLSNGMTLAKFNFEELNKFSEKLFSYGDDGYNIIFDLFYGLGYHNKELKKTISPILKKCILKLGFRRKVVYQLDEYIWTESINSILKNEHDEEFAIFINNSIIDSITLQSSSHLNLDIKITYEILMKNYFNDIWQSISEILISKDEEYIKYYGMKHILGSYIGGIGRGVGVLFDGDIDAIFEWCHKNESVAPARLAELVPIFDGNNDKYSSWNPITLRLINEFGNIEVVLRGLSTNMGTYSWSGPIATFLEYKKELFTLIKDHRINAVSEWAKKNLIYLEDEIKRENIRYEEEYL